MTILGADGKPIGMQTPEHELKAYKKALEECAVAIPIAGTYVPSDVPFRLREALAKKDQEILELKKRVEELEEYEWKYNDLCH